jgi:predicted nucleic acid-binding protein
LAAKDRREQAIERLRALRQRQPPEEITEREMQESADADMLVSGDARLLNLKHYQGIPIITPAEALQRIERQAVEADDSQDQ